MLRLAAIGVLAGAPMLVFSPGTVEYGKARAAEPASAERQQAAAILQATGISGGLIVHLGCGDGRLAAALAAESRCLIHGLDSRPENVRQAREHLLSCGLAGRASADVLCGEELPYADSLVNLLVVEQSVKVSQEELLRVLVPGGVALLRQAVPLHQAAPLQQATLLHQAPPLQRAVQMRQALPLRQAALLHEPAQLHEAVELRQAGPVRQTVPLHQASLQHAVPLHQAAWLQQAAPLRQAALPRQDAGFTTLRKDWPAELDQWTHFLHDASNNAVARDQHVGAPRHVQWQAGPLWSRSHEFNSSLAAMVSAGGRLYLALADGTLLCLGRRVDEMAEETQACGD